MEFSIVLAFLIGVMVGIVLMFLTQESEEDLLVVVQQRVRREALEAHWRDRED